MTLWSFPIVCGTNVCVSGWNLESDYESCFALMLSVFQFSPSVDFSRFAKTGHWNIDTDFMNASNFPNVREGLNGTLSSEDPELLIFAVYKMILSPVTVIGDGLLVVTGIVDPLQSFRNPSSLLVLTMSAANVLTGMVVAPIFAALEYNDFFDRKQPLEIANIGSSFLSLNISFGMVFALAFDNFIAVFRPTKYRTWITIQRAKIYIAIISRIALTFAILPHVNVPIDTVLKIDLHLNSTLNSILLVVFYQTKTKQKGH